GDERRDRIDEVRRALLLGKVMAYVQGFHEISVAAREYGWEVDLGGLASIWRAGCIIRARLLDRVVEAFDAESAPPTLLADSYVRDVAGRCQAALRSTVMLAIEKGIAVPGLASTLRSEERRVGKEGGWRRGRSTEKRVGMNRRG